MKKKLICGMLVGSLIFSSVILTGCGNSSDIDQNTTTQEQNTAPEANFDNSSANANETENSSNNQNDLNNSKAQNSDSSKDNSKAISNDKNKKEPSNSSKNETENSKNIDKDTSSNTESSNSNSETNDSNNKNSKDNTNIDSSKNTANSTNKDISKDSSAKEVNNLSMQQLADKIADFEYGGNVKYITPVKPLGSGKDLTYEEDSSSNIFFCSDDKFDSKNLKYGTLVNLFGYDKKSDSYSFRVTNYESLKNGGTGTIDYGTITSQGKINSANAN